LAAACPAEGGDYAFLTKAYGRPIGFLFAWCELWVIRPGSIGGMAFAFGEYANELVSLGPHSIVLYAVGAIVLLSSINILGVASGKWTQNVLTAAKVAGLLTVITIGLTHTSAKTHAQLPDTPFKADWALAMILILYAYGGWNDMAYVGAEVRDPERNILRALLLGTATVTIIYVFLNMAFVRALGLEGFRAAKVVAADVTELAGWPWARAAVSALVAISALGAINGMILTGGRIYRAMGTEHRLFAMLGRWSSRLGTPAWSLAVQGLITLAVVCYFGIWTREPNRVDRDDAFQRMVEFSLPLFWAFLLLVAISLFVLRRREPGILRPFLVPFYPFTPLVFCLACGWMEWTSLQRALIVGTPEALWVLAAGVIVAVFSWARAKRSNSPTSRQS
jgi:amino acid transporter